MNPWMVESLEAFQFYNCPECNHCEKQPEDFIQHARLHHANSQCSSLFKSPECDTNKVCDECGEVFKYHHTLLKHMATKHGIVSVFECDKCDMKFWLPALLRKHKSECHNLSVTQVAQVSDMPSVTQVTQLSDLTSATQVTQLSDVTSVTDVSKQTNSSSMDESVTDVTDTSMTEALLGHEYAKEEEKWECYVCDFVGKNKDKLMAHVRKEHKKGRKDGPPSICDICDASFKRHHSHLEHMSIVHGKKMSFHCKYCQFKTTLPSLLKKHEKDFHQWEMNARKCNFCQYFGLNVETHMIANHKEYAKNSQFKKINCDTNKTEGRKGTKTKKSDIKNKVCDTNVTTICDNRETNVTTICDTDVTMHDTNVTSISDNCDTNVTTICDTDVSMQDTNVTTMFDKGGTIATAMRHINYSHPKTVQIPKKRPKRSVTTSKTEKQKSLRKTDENVVGVKCGICDKVFGTRNLLVIHVKQCHNGKRDIKCNKCEWTTENMAKLKQHMNLMHDTRRYKCDKCDQIVQGSRNYRQHKKLNHSINLSSSPM